MAYHLQHRKDYRGILIPNPTLLNIAFPGTVHHFIMRVLFLILVLSTFLCRNSVIKGKKADEVFRLKLVHSYLCTGNREWWKKIPDDMLRYMMHVSVTWKCNGDITDTDVLSNLLEESKRAVQLKSLKKRTEVSDCLWKGIKDWHFIPFFCPLSSEKFMQNYDESVNYLVETLCSSNSSHIRGSWNWIGCSLGRLIFEKMDVIREVVHPYLCESSRQRRQYDVVSMMAIFKQTACLESSAFNFDFVAIKEGGNLHFLLYGFWCCIMKFVET